MARRRQHLAQRRKAAGHSQEKLAELLGIDRSTVVRWEAGETEPQPWVRPKLARALSVTAEELHWLLQDGTPKEAAHHGAGVVVQKNGSMVSIDDAEPLGTGFNAPPPDTVVMDVNSLAWTVGRLDQNVDRRTVLQLAATMAAGPALGAVDPLERMARALTRPTGMSEDIVNYLEARTIGLHRLECVLPAEQIFRGLLAHLNELTSLLEASQRDQWHKRLSRTAGESAVLGAWLAWDLGDLKRAASLYDVAKLAAGEADDPAINACSAIYQSFATSAIGDHATARRSLAAAHQYLPGASDPATRAWLIGREAEEAAALGDPSARDMIKRASDLLADARPQTERSWTRCLESPQRSHMRLTIATRLGDEADVYDGVSELMVSAGDPALKKTGRVLASIGLALVKLGDVEEGIRFGERSVEAVRTSRATYAMNRLAELGTELHGQARARELRDGIRTTRLELAAPRPSTAGTTSDQR